MNQDYIQPNEWSILEEGFDVERVKSSESLFSIGNGVMGQRANFEENYSGPSFQGSYIGGVYYPDKTKVGWWKNGYPEYFAKVLNAPNWIGINVFVNDEALDLFTCKKVEDFKRELNMKEGFHRRSFVATLPNDIEISVKATRFLSIVEDELGAIDFEIEVLNSDAEIRFEPYLDGGITNTDANWEERFWKTLEVKSEDNKGFVLSKTLKTEFHVNTYMQSEVLLNGEKQNVDFAESKTEDKLTFSYSIKAEKGQKVSLRKYAGYVTDMNHKRANLVDAASKVLDYAAKAGFSKLLQEQKEAWEK
ncbi:MAG: glycoside hydrolase family 65 protein, partial [Salegentibacter mishustinae]|nr:glycoside hydrolase family 65 protein [Salegentibacter mishustinae]